MAVDQKDRVAQGRALWQLGSVLGDQGQFKNAEVPLRDALALLESELGSDHLDIAKACNGSSPRVCLYIEQHAAHTTAAACKLSAGGSCHVLPPFYTFFCMLDLHIPSSSSAASRQHCYVDYIAGKAIVNDSGSSCSTQ